ncbi:YfiR family protein [Phenylobacterium sp. LjRoot225]|uniref:YfiR family protein n=1 Tax=Phenylobacterium sp. LjRoot225 TaxID=3342285 RepID=UPI003ECE28A3
MNLARRCTSGVAGLAAILATLGLESVAQAQDRSIEYAVKAAYLQKFAPFVAWPPSAFPSPSSPFAVCVLGRDPFGANLDQAVSGQSIFGHPMVVRRLDHVDGNSGCHILYVGASRNQSPPDALRAVRGAPTLTVADGGAAGAVIQFVLKGSRVRFDIDTGAAAANRLTISSKLLSLATSVRPDSGSS